MVNTLTDDPDERIEAFTAGQGADVVIEAVGAPETIEAGLRWFGPAGRYVLLGLYGRGTSSCRRSPLCGSDCV